MRILTICRRIVPCLSFCSSSAPVGDRLYFYSRSCSCYSDYYHYDCWAVSVVGAAKSWTFLPGKRLCILLLSLKADLQNERDERAERTYAPGAMKFPVIDPTACCLETTPAEKKTRTSSSYVKLSLFNRIVDTAASKNVSTSRYSTSCTYKYTFIYLHCKLMKPMFLRTG